MLALGISGSALAEIGEARVLDGFEDASAWRVVTSNQVTGSTREVTGEDGGALCLDYDFNGVSGYVGIQRDLAIEYPENYRFGFRLRGESPANDLQFKLIDASGDNVWWVNRPRYDFPAEWTDVGYRKRHIDKAWGPDPDPALRTSATLEFTVYNNAGGSGSVCFDELKLSPLPVDDGAPLVPVSIVGSGETGDAQAAVDGDSRTAWRASAGRQRLELDLGRAREFDGLRLEWREGAHASRYAVALSDDGSDWREVRRVEVGNGGVDWLALPESEARHVALVLAEGPGPEYALAGLQLQPIGFASHPNDFIAAIAGEARRGRFPRGFSGEQPYWTILGVDGGSDQGLFGEDGAVEVARGGFSIEPFVRIDDRLVTWADVEASQSLQDGYLPIPSVHWEHPELRLDVTAFAHGDRGDARLVSRYRLENAGSRTREFALALAIRPLQVNPPSQFLNTIGGVSRIDSIAVRGRSVTVNGAERVHLSQAPDAAFATAFDAGMAVAHLDSDPPATRTAVDGDGLASAALLYRMRLAPGESREIDLRAPLGEGTPALATGAADLQEAVAADWRDQLDRVRIEVPEAGRALVDTLRTSLAHMLVSRIGPRLQPGTRSYSRSWIRDGAMISEGLLRMGREDVVKEYVEWYAPYQFRDGMVPCCVDDRGSDPVPENDSHGELIFNIAEYWRYTGDDAFLERMWPHVAGAFGYMETLRASERTEANRAVNPAFYGMMPASISHEGYSAKPMHSYWDNFWALRGYKDAVEIAKALGRGADARRMAAARDEFRADLYASLQAAARLHGIDYLPGAAELGDFDPTSTTIALAPGGEQGRLPPALLRNTFERYWREFVQRRDGARQWKDYTPYEWRNVAAFVRLGWRGRAWEAVEYFFDDRAPRAWNQWGEVVSRTPREPFFLGDLPHAWVGSDFVRSALDMFAYVREVDDSVVLAAGIPADWLGDGIGIHGLRTPHGTLGYAITRVGDELVLDIDAGTALPAGGLVLPWPYPGEPGAATVDGQAARWEGPELRIREAPAQVRIAIP
ncbi:discoidin domain-containing protein [Luteimonas sp. RD2P54]|uniref:Discoidin domain-containing protein n=1 Tax=Luteimonas endophytica TaxID=3042023 RepID=A0ABT6J493_9GAMM|nr:discoidin domain-containing protein [Luteimonas endophytica]MDH5821641.1 discoidin domain-containing protein [Luteimonas endophytica]